MAEKEKAIIAKEKNYNLESPMQLKAMANVLKEYIVKNKLSVDIAGKQYVMVEGWQFAGGLLGTMPQITEIRDLTKDEIKPKWMAKAEIIRLKDGKVMSIGYAVCSKTESKKSSFDEYAILSMAQTRAIGKAYRNVIGWVIKMAGYESVPSEEMPIAPSKTPAGDAVYTKAISLIGAATTTGELEQFKRSLQKGRGAKLYNAEQRDQLIRMIDAKVAEINKDNG